ncbi:membrane protein involved in the export of O-antigen and teichoic acid [Nostoc sp. PCC 7524]|uniref:oligosaccharide flippase family protein n=1 Tax=Nostoc sp. (strain ATCC 29411 / PCC 7524) TaxID=28072 RepID=UPI00029EE2EA|nr:oligosaccharide flippase family protein [Nostoc sp. PCC 7524]AFY50746.1 membrane protein involved in the export of O-antigen and teichoic acid [Nostoc sp. PCC 7524]
MSINNIKSKVIQGSIYLTIRQLLASGFSLVSALVIARILGPKNYGIVTTSLGIFYFLKWSGRLGLSAYLVRKPNLSENEAQQVLCFYNVVGIAFCFVSWLVAPAFGWWTGQVEVAQLLQWLVPAIWLDMIGSVPASMQERELRFKQVGLIDAIAQIANYLLSIAIVLMYKNYWGVIAGTILQFMVFASVSFWCYPMSWRWKWHWQDLKPAIHYGLTYYFANWLFTLKSLTIPLFVSRLAGIEAAGIANMATRILQQLSLLRNVVNRMSLSVIAKLLEDPSATQRAISRGMTYQALLMGTICASFACCASWLIPTLFGEKWVLSAQIFPMLGFAAVVGSIFDLHTSALYAAGHNRSVAIFNFGYLTVLWLGSILLIPIFGLWGYGAAELIALPRYFWLHRSLTKLCNSPNYWHAFWIIFSLIPPIISGIFLPPLINFVILFSCYGLLFLLNANIRKTFMELWSIFRSKQKQVAQDLTN